MWKAFLAVWGLVLTIAASSAGLRAQTTRPVSRPKSPEPTEREMSERLRLLTKQAEELQSKHREFLKKEGEALGKETPKIERGPAEGKPAFDEAQALEYAREVMPLVEKAAGRRFKQTPRIRLVGRKEAAELLVRDLLPQFENLLPDMSPKDRKALAETQARAFTPALLGKYGVADRTLYLLPKNFELLMKLHKLDAGHTPSVSRLIIAHELTHALQDQHVGLARRVSSLQDFDEMLALEATIEGHACFVSDQVGEMMKITEPRLRSEVFVKAGKVKTDDPLLEMVSKVLLSRHEQVYVGGAKFIRYHYSRGGNEQLWRILADPPVASSMIAAPETYSTLRRQKLDCGAILKGLEKQFGNGPWTVQSVELGHMALGAAYANMTDDQREEILRNIAQAHALVANDSHDSVANVSIFILNDASFSRKMIAALEAMAVRNMEKARTGGTFKLSGLEFRDLSGARADVARVGVLEVTLMNETTKQTFARIARGNVVVEMWVVGLEAPDDKLVRVADIVFKRMAGGVVEAPRPDRPARRDFPPSTSPAEPPGAGTQEQDGRKAYIVKPGNTFVGIMKKHGADYYKPADRKRWLEANTQIGDPALIRPGQKVYIPE
ncbi:MAG TPA: hypothetical protein VM098_09690 [Phycisphaerae bacterium]|nr:hypothetical protein [Phycisphaerae bacterium]